MANTRDTIGDQATIDGLVNHTLTSLEEDGITTLGDFALFKNTALTSVNFPNATSLETYALNGCTGLTSITLPKVNSIGTYALAGNTNLTTVNLSGTGTKTISANAFNGSSKMAHLLINSSAMSTLSNTNALKGTLIARGLGAVYVPSSLISTYKANTNWSNYLIADINDYPLSDFNSTSDSWATIIANSNYDSDYPIGTVKSVDFGTFGTQYFELVAKDEDNKADNTGKARMTWVSKAVITTHAMNSTSTTDGGYDSSAMKAWITSDVLPELPSVIRNAIVPVTKVSSTYSSAIVKDGQTTTESLWLLSNHELGYGTTCETTGAVYSSKFSSNVSRIKYNSSGSAYNWWLRSAYSATGFRSVGSDGGTNGSNANGAYGVVLGFCI